MCDGKGGESKMGKKFVSLAAITLFAFTLTFVGCGKKEEPAPPHRRQRQQRLRRNQRLLLSLRRMQLQHLTREWRKKRMQKPSKHLVFIALLLRMLVT